MPVLVAVGLILAVGLWGYLTQGDFLYIVNRLNSTQLASFASNAGWSGDDIATAVAIALAESGGDPMAHGDTTIGSGTGSFGLWQIYSDAHPEYSPFTQLYDPQTNANAAFAIFGTQGFGAWSTYNNGAYESHLSVAQAGVDEWLSQQNQSS